MKQKNTQSQGLKQSQSVMMTPQMQLAMRVLALGQQELSDVLSAEIEANPLLDQDNEFETDLNNTIDDAVLPEVLGGEAGLEHIEWPDDLNLDRAINEYESETLRDHGVEERPNIEHYISEAPSLERDLRTQIYELSLPDAVRRCAEDLLYWLDADGYLRESDHDIAALTGHAPNSVLAARKALQSCSPKGLAARDLRECLALQLVEIEIDVDEDTLWLVLDKLDVLTKHGPTEFSLLNDLNTQDVLDIITALRKCDPKPGRVLETADQNVQAPDVIIRQDGDIWIAEINEALLPSLHIREGLWEELARQGSTADVKKYLETQRQSARWLQKIVNTRAMSLLRVSYALIAKQSLYLEKGVQYLRPMTIRELADDVGLNEATVSRVVANKLIDGPFGIVAMRDLFTSAVGQNAEGDAYAAGAVKSRIQALIDGEPVKKPLSDDKLVGLLAVEGIPIARRTVTKYREAMGLGSSVERKRQKQFSAT